jgi:Ulp1 family protease
VIVENKNPNLIQLAKRDYETLIGNTEVNDNIIDKYFNLLSNFFQKSNPNEKQILTFSCFFYIRLSNKQFLNLYSKDINLFDYSRILIPIIVDLGKNVKHWMLIVVDFDESSIKLYNSSSLPNKEQEVLKLIRKWLDFEVSKYNKTQINWRIIQNNSPTQLPGCKGCGIFCMQFAKCVVLDQCLTKIEKLPINVSETRLEILNEIYLDKIYR